MGPVVKQCENCGTPLQGEFCHACGQRGIELRRPVIGLAQDIIVETLSIDSKLLRTIKGLLWNPGAVARDYIAGHRVKYSPPFRIYLFFSLIFFALLFFSLSRLGESDVVQINDIEEEIEAARTIEPEPNDAIDEGDLGDGADTGDGGNTGEEANVDEEGGAGDAAPITVNVDLDEAQPTDDFYYTGPAFLEPFVRRMKGNIDSVQEDPRLFQSKLKDTIPRVLLLLPVFYMLLLLIFYFYKKNTYVYDLLIISLYMHAALYFYLFLSLLFQATPLANIPVLNWTDEIISVWMVVQPYRALKANFDTRWLAVIVKGSLLNFAYWVIAMILVVTGLALSLLG